MAAARPGEAVLRPPSPSPIRFGSMNIDACPVDGRPNLVMTVARPAPLAGRLAARVGRGHGVRVAWWPSRYRRSPPRHGAPSRRGGYLDMLLAGSARLSLVVGGGEQGRLSCCRKERGRSAGQPAHPAQSAPHPVHATRRALALHALHASLRARGLLFVAADLVLGRTAVCQAPPACRRPPCGAGGVPRGQTPRAAAFRPPPRLAPRPPPPKASDRTHFISTRGRKLR